MTSQQECFSVFQILLDDTYDSILYNEKKRLLFTEHIINYLFSIRIYTTW